MVNTAQYRSSLRQISQMVGLVKLAMTNSWLPALAYGGQMLSLQQQTTHKHQLQQSVWH